MVADTYNVSQNAISATVHNRKITDEVHDDIQYLAAEDFPKIDVWNKLRQLVSPTRGVC